MSVDNAPSARNVVFISKATPGDDEFVLWLAPRLEAAGYTVFADILNLDAGDRWRKRITSTLQNEAIKMLLCCRDSTLEKEGVQEEIGIAQDLVKELKDPQFIIPLRIEKFKKLFGIGELQWVNFVGSWANGLRDLLESLEKQDVPRTSGVVGINPSWEAYKNRLSVKLENKPEVLTSNWLRIASVPATIYYYQPTGSVDHTRMEAACVECAYPAQVYLRGFFSFAFLADIEQSFATVGKFAVHSEHNTLELIENGCQSPSVFPREAKNMISSLFRKGWEAFCRSKGLYQYAFSNQPGFHVTKDNIAIGKRMPWGDKTERRSSMLRNIATGKVWQYGASASPQLWPFPHFRIKARVLFSELAGLEAGPVFEDAEQQHRFRRGVCKGWRNKVWHGRLMAFLELLSEQSESISLPLGGAAELRLDTSPIQVTCPVSTALPDTMSEEDEEQDLSTLGQFDVEDEDGNSENNS